MTLKKPLAATAAVALGAAALALAMVTGTSHAATAAAASCAKASLALVHKGQITIATDAPAYPPYFEDNKPANGKGFESAVAYAVAAKLGFPASQVKWTVEPFDSSYAPGPKSFDFDINEISITSARAKAVDFSTPYYYDPQAVVAVKGSKYAARTASRRCAAPSSACRSAPRASRRSTPRSSRPTSRRSSTGSNDVVTSCASTSSTRSSSTSRRAST